LHQPEAAYPASSERRAVSRDWPQGTGVLSSSRRLSQNDGLATASWVTTRPIVGASARRRLL
jgi:hypothetical protein